MLFLTLFTQILFIINPAYKESINREAIRVLNASSSPAEIEISKYCGLMMVYWPDAIVSFFHPGIPPMRKTLTYLDGYSFFAFKDDLYVQIYFKTNVSFYVTRAPHKREVEAIKYFSNQNKYSVTPSNTYSDVYLSAYGPYSVNGTLKYNQSSAFSRQIYYYNSTDPTVEKRTNLSYKFSLESVMNTTTFSPFYSSTIDVTTEWPFTATVPTTCAVSWNGANVQYFHSYIARGGFGDNTKSSLLNELQTLSIWYNATLSTEMKGASFWAQVNDEESMILVKNNDIINRSDPYNVTIYYNSSSCPQLTKIKTREVDVFDKSTIVQVSEEEITNECLPEKKSYFIRIKNDISLGSNVNLTIVDENYEKTVIHYSESYNISIEAYGPFSVSVYINSLSCDQLLETVTASETITEIIFDDSNVIDTCIPYYVCLKPNLPSGYILGYKDPDDIYDDNIYPIETELSIQRNSSFEIQLYLVESPNCESNLLLNKIVATKNYGCQTFTGKDLPVECRPVEKYKVCFDVSNVPDNYSFGYNEGNEIIPLTSQSIESESPFSVSLYLMASPKCPVNYQLNKTYEAQIDFECVSLSIDDVPDQCKPLQEVYSIEIQNNVSTGFTLYVKNGDSYTEVVKGTPFQASQSSSFSIDVYVTSDICKEYTLVKTLQSSLDLIDPYTIVDSDIPKECITESVYYYMCMNFSAFSSDYHFGYILSDEENATLHNIVNDELLNISRPYQFWFNLTLISSAKCKESEFIGSYPTFEDNNCIKLALGVIPKKCINDDAEMQTHFSLDVIETLKPTEMITPPQNTEIIDDIYISGETNETNLNATLIEKFDQLKNDANPNSNKIVNIVTDSNTIPFNSNLNDDQLIKVRDGTEIQYNGGNLNLALLETGKVDVVINNEENTNIRLYGNGEINLKLPENNNKPDEEISLNIGSKSDINGSVIINVPNNVNSLSMNSINLESKGDISVLTQNKDTVKLIVKTVNAAANTESNLKNMVIQDSFKVVQSASIKFEDIEFNDKANIEYQIYNYENLNKPIFKGTLNKPPKNFRLLKPEGNQTPQKEKNYVLIEGDFENGNCDSWGSVIDYSLTGFNSYLCNPSQNAKVLANQGYTLSVRSIDEQPTKKPKNYTGMIIGIVVACVVVIAVIVVVVVVIKKRKKNNSSSENDNQKAESV